MILGAAICLSVGMIAFAINKVSEPQRNTGMGAEPPGSIENTSESVGSGATGESSGTNDDTTGESGGSSGGMIDGTAGANGNADETGKYTVKFYDLNGELVKTVETAGGFVEPPQDVETGKDRVFRGWDKDILNVRDNTDFYPITVDISDMANVLYLNSAYVSSGQLLKADLNLGGIVGCSDIRLAIEYKPMDLKYVGSENDRADTITEHDEQNNSIMVTVSADSNITSAELLSTLMFQVVTEGFIYTELKIKLDKLEMLREDGRVSVDCAMYNGEIYIY